MLRRCLRTSLLEAIYGRFRVAGAPSGGEFESVIGKFQDVIVIDLLPKCSDRPRPFPEASFLFIEPDEFHDVLRWAPRSSCVVLYGRSNFCKSMILAARDIAGHAPIFVLAVES